MDVSSKSVVLVQVEEKVKKPEVNLPELNMIPKEDEKLRVSLWLMKSRPHFPNCGYSDDDDSSDDEERDSPPGPSPSQTESQYIDFVGGSEANLPRGVVGVPSRKIDNVCCRSLAALKRKWQNRGDNQPSVPPAKYPRFDEPSENLQCKRNVATYVKSCDFIKSPPLELQKSHNVMLHSSTHSSDNMIVFKPAFSLHPSQSNSSEETTGVIGTFFKWLFPDV